MNNTQNKLDFLGSLSEFLTKWLNFSGRSTQFQHWVGTLSFTGLFTAFYFVLSEVLTSKAASAFQFLSILGSSSGSSFNRFLSSFQDSKFAIYSVGLYTLLAPVLLVILFIAFTSSLSRRLRDIGFANGAITILLVLLHLLLLLAVPYLSITYFVLVGLVLPVLATDSVLTNNNDGFSKFLFRQNPAATAYYAQFNNQGYGYNPNIQGQNYNQNQQFGQNPQGSNQTTTQPVQPVVQEPIQQTAPVQPVQAPTQNVEANVQTETPKEEKSAPVNPFGDQVFKK